MRRRRGGGEGTRHSAEYEPAFIQFNIASLDWKKTRALRFEVHQVPFSVNQLITAQYSTSQHSAAPLSSAQHFTAQQSKAQQSAAAEAQRARAEGGNDG